MKRLKLKNLNIHLFYLVLIAFIGLGFIIYTYRQAEGVLKEGLQTCQQDLGTCVSNFEEISPQLEQKTIHLYPAEAGDSATPK